MLNYIEIFIFIPPLFSKFSIRSRFDRTKILTSSSDFSRFHHSVDFNSYQNDKPTYEFSQVLQFVHFSLILILLNFWSLSTSVEVEIRTHSIEFWHPLMFIENVIYNEFDRILILVQFC